MPVATIHTASGNHQGIDLSLVRITELLKRLSHPQSKYPVIHIAGTNSKGSTVAYLSSVLNDYIGISTASFTSPHLRIERDCCKVGSQIIDEAIWEEAGKRVQQADDAAHETAAASSSSSSTSSTLPLNSTLFEKLAARCFVAFDLLPTSQRPEVLLIEVGMGGAKDATNVFSPSQVLASVICPIDYDHQIFLGNTLADIAEQKAGIVKQGGLCIMADQRRPGVESNEEEDDIDCTKVKAADGQSCFEGREVAEIQNTIRQTCSSLKARLVKAYVPWKVLYANSSSNNQLNSPRSPWSAPVESHVRYTPVLMESKTHTGDFISSTGDVIVPGPTLWLPRTRAALTGCHLALQTLWSIARDETPFALGQPGSDANEDLRLRIAFALRDDRFAQQDLRTCIEHTSVPGRAEWIDIQPKKDSSSMQIDGEQEGSNTLQLHLLVDGAHNASAASALGQYVDSCLQLRIGSSKQQQQQPINHVTVTWIIAFSQGKDITNIIEKLFNKTDSEQDVDNLTSKMVASLLDTHIEHRVACLPFTTPVEGMPWVGSVPADQIAAAVTTLARSVVEVKTFEALEQALLWATAHGDGKSIIDGRTNLVVIAGSLYLVSDVHRFIS